MSLDISRGAAASRRQGNGNVRTGAIQYGLFALTVVLVGAPIIPILWQSILVGPLYDTENALTFSNFANLLGTSEFWNVISDTLILAVLATIFAIGLGVTAAVLVGRTNLPGRRWLGEIFIWPLYVSSLILSFAWVTVYGPSGFVVQSIEQFFGFNPWNIYSLGGMSIVAGTSMAPIVFVYTLSSARLIDPSYEDAARIAGAGQFTTLLRVTLPLMRPAILFSSLLVFTSSLEILSIPLVFGEPSGIRTFSTFLYKSAQASGGTPNYGIIAAAAILLILVVLLLLLLQHRLLGNTKRFVGLGGKAGRTRLFELGRLARWVIAGLAWLYIGMTVVLPIGMLFVRASVSILHPLVPLSEVVTIENFAALLEFPVYVRSITNSFLVSGIGAAIATVLTLLVASVVNRSDFRWKGQLLAVSLLPRAIPGMVAGIGFFYAASIIPIFSEMRSTIWILIIAFTMANIPLGYGAIGPMMGKISPDLDRAARVQGADWWTATRLIVFPLAKPAIIACYTVLFIAFFKDYSTAVFLYTIGSEVIGTTLLQFWIQGQIGHVAALSVLQIVTIAACLGLARLIFGVKMYG